MAGNFPYKALQNAACLATKNVSNNFQVLKGASSDHSIWVAVGGNSPTFVSLQSGPNFSILSGDQKSHSTLLYLQAYRINNY